MGTIREDVKLQENIEKIKKIDYKMVTFSLAGKDYGIDIMAVKEISKDKRFTYVPNTAPFVRGIYNLRGDIISIIDLRVMFNLPAEKKADTEMENMIILKIDDHVLGVIVDSIDKVVGISSDDIQPPHPLFADINIKYIHGVIEHDERLYIILDVERIFGIEEEHQEAAPVYETAKPSAPLKAVKDSKEIDFTFITEALAAIKKFYVTGINEDWVKNRLAAWKDERKKAGLDIQITRPEDADAFIRPFYSPYTSMLWEPSYLEALVSLISSSGPANINVWNPGCYKGYESYSIACALKKAFPEKRIKVWANDNDLLNISMAPNLFIQEGQFQDFYSEFVTETKNGYQFNNTVRETILFEYHDVLHPNPFPDADIIIARDLLSFLKPLEQQRLAAEFFDRIKPGGILILGKNERLLNAGWRMFQKGELIGFQKEQ